MLGELAPRLLGSLLERQEVGATYNVHVLVACPLDAPDLLPTGIAVP